MSLEEILFDSSRAAADMAVDIISQKPEMFDEAYRLCMAQNGTMALRSARVVQLVAEEYPEITGELIAALHILIDNSKETLSKYSKTILRELYKDAVP